MSLSRTGTAPGLTIRVIHHGPVGCETDGVSTGERDRDLGAILIGGRERREIVIVEYDADWPARFESERARVRCSLGAAAIRIEHIGSTAVRVWRRNRSSTSS